MSCKEIDGNGNVKVFTFTVRCFQKDDEWPSMRSDKRFVDYTDGWNWARQYEQEVYDNDPDTETEDAFVCKIDYDYEWIPDGQVETYLQEELNDD
jgi:hypothetical protein